MITLQPSTNENQPWTGYSIIRDGELVGQCGFKSIPRNGKVEIAYYTFENFEKQGIATEACRLLTELSIKTDPAIIVTARTLMEENASTRILKRNKFEFAGEVADPEDGNVWEWKFVCSETEFNRTAPPI
jgi:[ribosomal protein S5]-alanine N-acetyltransferase